MSVAQALEKMEVDKLYSSLDHDTISKTIEHIRPLANFKNENWNSGGNVMLSQYVIDYDKSLSLIVSVQDDEMILIQKVNFGGECIRKIINDIHEPTTNIRAKVDEWKNDYNLLFDDFLSYEWDNHFVDNHQTFTV